MLSIVSESDRICVHKSSRSNEHVRQRSGNVNASSVSHGSCVDTSERSAVGIFDFDGEAVFGFIAGAFVLLVLLDVGATLAGDVAFGDAWEGGGTWECGSPWEFGGPWEGGSAERESRGEDDGGGCEMHCG